MTTKKTRELIDRIFKEPGIKYELTEFETLGKSIYEILSIYPKTIETGRDAGKTKYYLKSIVPFSSGKEEVQVYVEGGKSAPEEIVRQLWVYKLIQQYGYRPDEIDLEKSVQFGTEVGTKAADIIVYTDAVKETPKIIVECKKPKRKDGIEQLKSYMNAKGAPVAVWSNGSDSIILYRPYPKKFDDTLFDIPRRGQQPKDVLEARKTLLQLRKEFNFKKIIQDLEELVLADSGKDEFNEIFKLIFAKIWDEKEAQENKKRNKKVEFSKALDPDITFDRINALFHKAAEEWPGIFRDGEDIELTKRHLQVCVGPIEGVRLMGSNLRAKDKAPKEERDVLFIERIVKMLKPGGRAAIVPPQGKFNNSSLAFIREWILKKARLLAVVGLHPNTFKPHTGTKTSVMLFQKYTVKALARIEKVKQEVANACPDYEQQIKDLIAEHRYLADVPEEKIPEEIADLMAESFTEPEPDSAETKTVFSEDDYELGEPERLMVAEGNPTQKALIIEAEEKRDDLKAELIRVKQKLEDLVSDIEALKQQHRMETDTIAQQWEGTKADLRTHLKPIKNSQKTATKKLKTKQKIKQRTFKIEIKHLEKRIPEAETAVKLLSIRGKLELILVDPDLVGTLKERWISAEVAKRLDYPIFMAVSERGGKNNSGDYEYQVDEDGSLVEFPDGHPQEGQLVVNQDLVNYGLTADELSDAANIHDDQLCVAEAFVRFAQEQGVDFWRGE